MVENFISQGGRLSSSQPTAELRWLPRLQKANFATDHDRVEAVLQQKWLITEYQHGKPYEQRSEWRDVPTATGEE